MMIRCRKCFRKYEDYEPECPKCGTINERDVDKKDKVTFKFIEKTCNFCGSKKNPYYGTCRVCGNEIKDHKETIDKRLFRSIVDQAYEKEGLLDTSGLKESFDISDWLPTRDFKYGVVGEKSMIWFIGVLGSLFAMFLVGSSSEMDLLVLLIVVGLPILLGSFLFGVYHRKEYIDFNYSHDKKLFINWMKKNDMERDMHSRYSAYLTELSFIELSFNENLESIRFVAKTEAELKTKDLTIDIREYEDEILLKTYLYLLSSKYKLPVKVVLAEEEKEDISVEKPIITYIRIERSVKEADKELMNFRKVYMDGLKDDYDLTYGQTAFGALMVIKSRDKDQLKLDLNRDPYIESGIIEAKLDQWDIK
ncbi:hypothetical protein EZV73_24825 [Acidaminobacter sp. JC074]|uniref:zinc ribbon domain-containing protein n=1 Tax=Acidaminobacter sp. JC074 TaxID=2530199 RepID=UPI001F110AD9|nr:zinc ribbon domain-containing protein [Acidaminobacter sp. JC074]MCH4890827.1 hypothetical protein [Acidaminobacter sp. JC074]